MAPDKINTIIDRKAVTKEIKDTSKEIREFIALIQSVKGTAINVSQAKSMQEYAKLRKELEGLISKTNESGNAAIQEAQARKADADAAILERKAIQELYKSQILEEKARQENLKTLDKENASKKKSVGTTLEEKIATQEATKIQKERIQLRNAEQGSLKQAELQYQKLTRIIYGFNEEQRNSSRGQTLIKYAEQLNQKLKDSDAKLNTFKRNVGNYAGSLAGGFQKVADEITKINKRQDELKSGFQNLSGGRVTVKGFSQGNQQGFDPQTTAQLQQFTAEIEQNDAALQHLNKTAQIGFQTSGNLGKQVKGLEKAYQDMASSGQVSNEFLDEFRKFVANSKDELLDLRGEIKALSSDTYAFDQIVSVVQTMTAAFQVGASVATLFGAKEEDVQKNIQKLLVIQNVANGVQQIANQLTLRGSVLNKAYAFTQGLVAVALDASATAAARFEAALGFIGIALAVVGALALAIYELGSNTEEAASATKFLGEAMDDTNGEYATAVKQVTSLKVNIDLAKKGFADKKDVIKEYNETLGKTTGEVKTLDEAEKAITKNADAYIEATLLKAAANLALEDAARKTIEIERNTQKEVVKEVFDGSQARVEAVKKAQADPEYKKLIQEGNDALLGSGTSDKQTEKQKKAAAESLKISQDKFDAAKKIEEKYFNESLNGTKIAEKKQDEEIATGLLKRLGELRKKFNFKTPGTEDKKDNKEDEKFYAGKLELQRDAFNKIADNEEQFISDRINARKKAAGIEMQIVFGQTAAEIKNAKGNVDEIKTIREKESVELTKIAEKRNDDIIKLQKEFVKHIKDQRVEAKDLGDNSQAELFVQLHEEKIKQLEDDFEVEQAYQERSKKLKLEELSKQFKLGLISEKEYNEKKSDIDVEFQLKALQQEINFARKLIDIKKSFGLDTKDDEQKLALLQIQLDNAVTDNHIRNNEKKKKSDDERYADLQKQINTIGDLSKNIGQAIFEISSIGYDQAKDIIDQQIEDLEKKKEKDIEVATASIANEKERAAVIANITELEKIRIEQLNRRKRQLAIEQARFERVQNIADIIQRTALAVVTTLADKTIQPGFLRIPLAISVGALGAAQLIRAVAAPLPRFAEGGEVESDGPIIVGDAGRHEKMNFPDGTSVKTPKIPTIVWGKKGTIIEPDYDKAMLKASVGVVPMFKEPIQMDNSTPAILSGLKEIKGAIEKMPQPEIHVDNLLSKTIRGNKILRA